ncbi:glycoside hydrolase family 20 zincin-like fold domain-containing protein [Microbacterium foliorum]|uniref:glycoside hydrolase family 20 zincin-like fold domain-containing protein n=1 Tax=Microbacterium foliorum TaxID=104336 RepID=UPI002869EF12|nr:hypothetical protein [Microbacterium foliorum]
MVLPHSMPLVPLPSSAVAGDGRWPVSENTRVIGDSPAARQLIDAAERRSGIRFSHSTDTTDPTSAIVLRVDPAVAPEGYTLRVADSVEVVGGATRQDSSTGCRLCCSCSETATRGGRCCTPRSRTRRDSSAAA